MHSPVARAHMCRYKYGPEKIKHSGPGREIVVELQPKSFLRRKLSNEIKYTRVYARQSDPAPAAMPSRLAKLFVIVIL
jgi:hypothetical protein